MSGIKKIVSTLLILSLFNICDGGVYAAGGSVLTKSKVASSEKRRVFIASGGGFLIRALSEKDFLKAKSYIELDVGIYDADDNLCTPLHYAVRLGNLEIVKMLVEKKVNVNEFDMFARTPLALSTDEEISSFLIEKGADPVLVEVNKNYSNGDSLLKRCVEQDDIEKVKELIDKGANPFVIDRCGRNLLCFCSSASMAKLLIELGVKVVISNDAFSSTLDNAIGSCNFELFKFLIDVVNTCFGKEYVDPERMIFCAARSGNIQVIDYFVGENLSFEWENTGVIGDMFCYAVQYGQGDVVDYILSKGIDASICGNSTYTPLHMAVRLENLEIAKKLIDNNADVNVKCYKGDRPLDLTQNKKFLKELKCHLIRRRFSK